MLYIEATLDNGEKIWNAEEVEGKMIVETSEGEELTFELSDSVTIQLYEKAELNNINDLINLAKNKKAYASPDSEDGTFQEFPEENFQGLINEDFFTLEQVEILMETPIGILKGKEKTTTFKEIAKILKENTEKEDEYY